MQLDWHLIVIVTALLLGICLLQKSEQMKDPADAQTAMYYRNFSYVLFVVAAVVAVYHFFFMDQPISVRAYMCGGKAHMCGLRH